MSARLRILLIEDNDSLRRVLSGALEAGGHTVMAAGNGAFGLRLLESDRFDLVITDILMPDTDGMEVLRALRRMESRPPVIAISGGGRSGSADYLEVAANLGANETLLKPFDIRELNAAIERVTG